MAIRIGRRRSGGVSIMSHPVNDEILENLYEEELDRFLKESPYNSIRVNELLAEFHARKRFEEMS